MVTIKELNRMGYMKMDYPFRLMAEREPILTLRINEVDGKNIEIADAIERKFWDLSNTEFHEIKKELGTLSANPAYFGIKQSIDKILAQRISLQNNQAFREALIPE